MDCNVSPDSTVFEFNAPQFLNFTTPNIDNDGADKFFDTVSEVDNDAVIKNRVTTENSHGVTTTSFDAQISNNDRCELNNESSDDTGPSSTSDGSTSLANKEWDYISSEVNAKIEQAKACASARRVKRAFAPAIEVSEDDPSSYKIVAVELFHPGIHLQPHKKYTKVQPFSFEERHKRLQKEKEEKIKKILEEEQKMREFHANPAPQFAEPSVRYPTVLCTDPKQPTLRTEERIQERKRNKTEDEKKIQLFKARPATVLQKPPFEPKKAECPLTDVTGFHLNTEERAKKREEFNLLIKMKEAELELLKLQRKKEEEKALAEEIRRMRKEAVHKAIPVPVFKHVPPVVSNIPLTEPKSPCFASRKLTKTHKH